MRENDGETGGEQEYLRIYFTCNDLKPIDH